MTDSDGENLDVFVPACFCSHLGFRLVARSTVRENYGDPFHTGSRTLFRLKHGFPQFVKGVRGVGVADNSSYSVNLLIQFFFVGRFIQVDFDMRFVGENLNSHAHLLRTQSNVGLVNHI